ncbi:CSEP0017 putative effector protein [Blumeria hordei DH14]|uniref:CSEP0017 putative effector protein n=1 Tax=Blumeria graminis f. sp. hordei (strain DH14) TaxID=546991 RepID=N1JDR3_BLUG1|nr:CSEP0017 putative effector protein [Blumeria hordei DH14]
MKFLSISGMAFILSLSGSVMSMPWGQEVLPVPDPVRSFSFTCGGSRTYHKADLDRYVDQALGRMNTGQPITTTQAFQYTHPGPYFSAYINPDLNVFRTEFNREEHVVFDQHGYIMGGMTYEMVGGTPRFVPCKFPASTKFM